MHLDFNESSVRTHRARYRYSAEVDFIISGTPSNQIVLRVIQPELKNNIINIVIIVYAFSISSRLGGLDIRHLNVFKTCLTHIL